MRLNINFNIPEINKVIRLLIATDFLVLTAWGFIDPIFSIFVVRDIQGATLFSVGILALIYWTTKSVVQIPVALFIDKTEGERDDFYSLVFGLMIIAATAFSLIIAVSLWQVYLIQFLKAIGFALYIPAWTATFSRHLDKKHTALDWAINNSLYSFGIGIGGFLGGWMSGIAGFDAVFLIVGFMALIAAGLLLFIPNIILPPQKLADKEIIIRDHSPANVQK